MPGGSPPMRLRICVRARVSRGQTVLRYSCVVSSEFERATPHLGIRCRDCHTLPMFRRRANGRNRKVSDSRVGQVELIRQAKSRLIIAYEPVADARFSEQMPRLPRIVLQLLAQLLHV